MNQETTDIQNTLCRLTKEAYLNAPNADTKTKRQYSKAMIALEKARAEFDTLNDMKAELRS